MHLTRTPLLAAAAGLALCAAAAPAWAQSFKLDKIEINGVTSVPVQPLRDALKDKPGMTVTTDDVLQDRDALEKALEDAHVTGAVKTSLRNKPNGHKDVVFDVADTGVQKPVVTTSALHLDHVSFSGNTYMKDQDLAAVAQMKHGDVVTDQSLADAQKRIKEAYQKASDNAATAAGKTTVAYKFTYPQPGQVDVVWQFTQESKTAKKKRNTEDEGFHTEAPDH